MHDPMTVAFNIPNPFIKRYKWGESWKDRPSLMTIWHVDPETGGIDDSCGWFMRSRHGNPEILERIRSRYEFEWSHGIPFGWFDQEGYPNYSTQSIVLSMFIVATNEILGHRNKKSKIFLRNHLYEILFFAENNCDSLCSMINQHYGKKSEKERIFQFSSIIYSWILREIRPWYKHPKWHFWHWKIQIHPWQNFRRWIFSKCCKCGKGFKYGESPMTNSYNPQKPKWFKSEENICHIDCSNDPISKVKS